jgi:hypothetical protein
MVKETGKAMAEQLYKVAEDVSNHVKVHFFNCSEMIQKTCYLCFTTDQVWKEK